MNAENCIVMITCPYCKKAQDVFIKTNLNLDDNSCLKGGANIIQKGKKVTTCKVCKKDFVFEAEVTVETRVTTFKLERS